MQFQHPFYLILLGLIPALIIWHQKYGKNNEGTLRFSSNFFSQDILKSGKRKYHFLKSIYLLILFLVVVGIARPRYVNMLADDFKPNRLEAVKKTASDFIEDRKEDRIGILVFAGESFIQCPLTIDKTVLASLVNEIEVASKEYDGTAIGMAIANGTNRLRNSNVDSKVMILLSDGSNNSGEIDPITAAELAAQFNVKIYTIGAGTNQSYTRIPGRGLIRNEIDEETLIQIAKVTGGRYFRATDIAALESIYSEISSLERSEIEVNEYTQYTELYGWFLIPAFILGMGMEVTRRSIFRMIT